MKLLLTPLIVIFAVVGVGSAQPVIVQQPTNQVAIYGDTATFSVSVSGTGPFSCQWLFNGTNISGGSQQAQVVYNPITTVAGNGNEGYSGDGSSATNAGLNYPWGVAVDALGNLFIADTSNQRIRKVGKNGIITTVAGNGTAGYSGDGSSATSASLYYPWGVAVDTLGNLFIADDENSRIRKVGTNGIITTVAGNGNVGYSGDGSSATSASLYYPRGLAVDALGNLFIADIYSQRIRKVGTNGIITTVAGNGTAGYSGDGSSATNAWLNYPCGVAVDALGNMFIADYDNQRIRKVGTNGIITTVAGNGNPRYTSDGGFATGASLCDPCGVSVDALGNLFIADTSNQRIRKVGTNGIITTIAGNGTAGYLGDGSAASSAWLNSPSGVAVDAFGDLFISDAGNERIRKAFPTLVENLALPNMTPANAGSYQALISDSIGNCVTSSVASLTVITSPIITSDLTSQVQSVSNSLSWGFSAMGASPLNYQWYFVNTNLQDTAGADAEMLYGFVYGAMVTNGGSGYATAPQVEFVGGGGAGAAGYAVVSNGVVTDIILTNAGWGYASLPEVLVDPPSTLLASATQSVLNFSSLTTNNIGSYFVVVSNSFGVVTSSIATLNMPAYILNQPQAATIWTGGSAVFNVAAGSVGPFSYQWLLNGNDILDATNASFAVNSATVNQEGIYAVSISNPYGGDVSSGAVLTVNSISSQPGNQIVVNGGTAAIKAGVTDNGIYQYQWLLNGTNCGSGLVTNGIITTVAGNFAGDGGLAATAKLQSPFAVVQDLAGNLFIADLGNNRIRKVATNGAITTVAGNGNNGYSGDGGPAINAMLSSPVGLAVDAAGDLFIADQDNNCVREVGTNGVITTVAGNGNYGYDGDNGLAVSAMLDSPSAVAVDSAGNLFIADCGNQRIRRVDRNGVITTVAGGGLYGITLMNGMAATNATMGNPTALAVDAVGNLFFVDGSNNQVWEVSPNNLVIAVAGTGAAGYSGDQGMATNAMLNAPSSIALDAFGNLFIADQGNCRIREVLTNGIITTIAGDGEDGYSGDGDFATSAMLSNPAGVWANMAGNIFIADTGNNRLREVSANGIITTVVGNLLGDGGFSIAASLSSPGAVTKDASGNLFIADTANNRIRKVATTGIITTVAGNGNAGYSGDGGLAASAMLNAPSGLALDASGNLFIADANNNCIREVTTKGIITTIAGGGLAGYSGDGDPAGAAWLSFPTGLAMDTQGNLFIADFGNQRIRKIDTNGIITTVAGYGVAGYFGDGGLATSSVLNGPLNVAVDAADNLFIVDYNNARIRMVATNGIVTTVAGNGSSGTAVDGVPATDTPLASPSAVAIDLAGELFISDSGNNRIRKVSANGIIITVAGNGNSGFSGDGGQATNAMLSYPSGITVDASGNLLIADENNNRVRQVTTNGLISTIVGNSDGDGALAVKATLSVPASVAVDGAGELFIADQGNQRIRKVGTDGAITTVAGNGNSGYSGDGGPAVNAMLSSPVGLATDATGDLFIADQGNNCVRKVGTNGVITTVAGNGRYGYSGDGGPAINAMLAIPTGVAEDSGGNLYIADLGNNRIRMVRTNGVIVTVAGNGESGYGYGYSGDGGMATNAMLSVPAGTAVDASGNLYIADARNNCIREVLTNGTITTVAGNGNQGYSGDGGLAVNATLFDPFAVAVDAAGNLYVADQVNNVIRKVATNGIITTIAGNGNYGYSGDGGLAINAMLANPSGMALGADGSVFIADQNNNCIRKVGFSNPILAVNSATTSTAGNYQIVITDSFGSVTSSVAVLSLAYPPSILWAPQSLMATQGNPASFNVAAAGTGPLNYQWWMEATQQSNATAVPFVINGFVLAAGITSGGAGYLAVPQVQFLGGSGIGATGTAVVSNRMVTAIQMSDAGEDYITPPVIQIDPPSDLILTGATNATLALPSVNLANSGNYFVVITNYYGSVTSSVATLAIAASPASIPAPLLVLATDSGVFHLQLSTLAGQPFVLYSATNLTPPVLWQPLVTNSADTNGFWTFTDTNRNSAEKYYRVSTP